MVFGSLIICGSGSLPREEEEEEYGYHVRATQSAGSSPGRPLSSKRSKRHHNHHHHNHDKNPYATRGLDKFCALLAEIEEKKQTIYSENNPDEICFVQFDYSNNNNCKPIVIKAKPAHNKEDQKNNRRHKTSEMNQTRDPDASAITTTANTDQQDKSEALDHYPTVLQADYKKSLMRRLKKKLRKPSFYLPAVLILVLIFLVLFGRSVAILCTSIVWYAIPTISERNFKNKGLVGHQGS